MAKIDNNYYPEVFIFTFIIFRSQLFLSLKDISSFRSDIRIYLFINQFHLYVQTLHRMYIVNAGPGFRKVLWPAAQNFLDAKTIAKIHVNMHCHFCPLYLFVHLLQLLLIDTCGYTGSGHQVFGETTRGCGSKVRFSFLHHLLWGLQQNYHLISCFIHSQLPDFLGGSCACNTEGGCLRSNKGPWNDPETMKVKKDVMKGSSCTFFLWLAEFARLLKYLYIRGLHKWKTSVSF